MKVKHPEIKPLSGKARKEYRKSKDDEFVTCSGCYSHNSSTIFLNFDREREGGRVLWHEFMHHLLTELVDEEASSKFDTSGLGYYLDQYLFPDSIDCLYCKYYMPSSIGMEEGDCAKHQPPKKTRSGASCPNRELDPIFKELPFNEFETWVEYRRDQRPVAKLYELAESKSEKVSQYYRKELERLAEFLREHPDQFNLDCEKLMGECDALACMDNCWHFEEGTPKIFRYLNQGGDSGG